MDKKRLKIFLKLKLIETSVFLIIVILSIAIIGFIVWLCLLNEITLIISLTLILGFVIYMVGWAIFEWIKDNWRKAGEMVDRVDRK